MDSARSATSVKPANLAFGFCARIASCTRALITMMAAAADDPSSSPAWRKESAIASVQASAAALAAA